MKKRVLASSNIGKLREFNRLFEPLSVVCLSQSAFGIPDALESAHTFLENALLKARHAAQLSGLPALADDSGLCVPALEGKPGIYSARYAGQSDEQKPDEQKNIKKLLQDMQGFTGSARAAYFCCTLVLIDHLDDPMPLIFQGQWFGEILTEPRGVNGFGYDSIFYLPALQKTAAELSTTLKNQLSHRAQAVSKLLEYWQAVCS